MEALQRTGAKDGIFFGSELVQASFTTLYFIDKCLDSVALKEFISESTIENGETKGNDDTDTGSKKELTFYVGNVNGSAIVVGVDQDSNPDLEEKDQDQHLPLQPKGAEKEQVSLVHKSKIPILHRSESNKPLLLQEDDGS